MTVFPSPGDVLQARRARLAEIAGTAAVLVVKPVNVRYLTGLNSSNAAVLIYSDGRAVLATDSRYAETARALPEGLEVVVEREVAARLTERAARDGVGELGFEAHAVTVGLYLGLKRILPLVPLSAPVEEVRMVKDESEIAALRRACAITDQAFADVLPRIRPGMTELELARALETRMTELGARKPAFDSIVAAGPSGAVPHHGPGERAIRRGDLVTMDFGALYDGYHADMTRTVAVGAVADWQRDLYDLVARAQLAGVDAVRPGAALTEVDAAARSVIEAAGEGEWFTHGLGHGVGLEIHELPFLTRAPAPDAVRNDPEPGRARLMDRVPITIEPGVYLPGRGGVRIEDTLVTRDDGPELLTLTTKELLVL
ncbi:M24 family metallopeptidase [Rhizohabitans arisaemae]|uniref:M24 family metallopeptidase n=1 Tax=Rhizohabitans arisaemae TaxID=2720610 RepID=UPI0024B06A1B|nr:aminopeptidase P family protein [Rhizohabitans arisaemae]